MTPNRENIRKWVDALRSGDYEQTTDALRIGDAFCCLGVACDVSGVGEWVGVADVLRYETGSDYPQGVCLPQAVQDWLGLDTGVPCVNGDDLLTTLNDEHRLPFSEIADRIEEEWL